MNNFRLARIIALTSVLLILPLAGSYTSRAQSNPEPVGEGLPNADAAGSGSFFDWHKQRLRQLGQRLGLPVRDAGQPNKGEQPLSWEVFQNELWPNLVIGFSEANREVPLWLEYNSVLFRVFIAPGKFLLSPLGITADNLIGLSIIAVLAAAIWTAVLRLLWSIGESVAAWPSARMFVANVTGTPSRVKLSWQERAQRTQETAKRILKNHPKLVYGAIVWHLVGIALLVLTEKKIISSSFLNTLGSWMLAPAGVVIIIAVTLGLSVLAVCLFVYLFVAVSVFYPLSFLMIPFNRIKRAYVTARQAVSPDADKVEWRPYGETPGLIILGLIVVVFLGVIGKITIPKDNLNVAVGARWLGFLLVVIFPFLIWMLGNLLHWLLVLLLLPFAALGTSFYRDKKAVLAKAFSTDDEEVEPKIPDGVALGDQVLVLPAIDPALYSALKKHNRTSYWYYQHASVGDWVNRGDVLCNIYIKRKASLLERFLSWDRDEISLRSPVSGIILDNSDLFSNSSCAILLPENEPAAEAAEYVFGDLCDYAYEHRAYIFQETKEPQGSPAYTDEKLKEILDRQRSGVYKLVSARTDYSSAIERLRAKGEVLQPLLLHLTEPATS